MKKSLTHTLINLSKGTNPSTLELGTIESISPFRVKVSGLLVTKENLLISESLIDSNRKINLNSDKSYEVSVDGESKNINSLDFNDLEVTLKSNLNINDLVVVQEIDNGQRYIILNKVIEL